MEHDTNLEDVESIEPHQWAWEFLRRNKEYQKLYKSIITALKTAQEQCKDQDLDEEEIPDFKWHDFSEADGLVNFGLQELVDPDTPIHEVSSNIWHPSVNNSVCVSRPGTPVSIYSEQSNKVPLVIDIRSTDEAICRDICHYVAHEREKQGVQDIKNPRKPSFNRFDSWLKVYDMRVSKIPNLAYDAIGCALWPGQKGDIRKRAHDHYKSAKRYVDGEYKTLLCYVGKK